jgi:hypothetical protein
MHWDRPHAVWGIWTQLHVVWSVPDSLEQFGIHSKSCSTYMECLFRFTLEVLNYMPRMQSTTLAQVYYL